MRSDRRYRPDRASLLTRVGAFAGLAFMHIPVLVIILYAFTTEDRTYQFPPPGSRALVRRRVRARRHLAVAVAVARGGRLRHGHRACARHARGLRAGAREFPGKDALTLLFVLPIALPGIITGIALLAAMKLGGVEPSFWTIVAGHTTFCIVIVYNNVIARLRRLPRTGWRPRWTWAPMAPDLPLRAAAAGGDGFPRRWHACLRAVVRRGHRHRLHGRQ
jgi:putative spermidine/putrescine transport system permease protein